MTTPAKHAIASHFRPRGPASVLSQIPGLVLLPAHPDHHYKDWRITRVTLERQVTSRALDKDPGGVLPYEHNTREGSFVLAAWPPCSGCQRATNHAPTDDAVNIAVREVRSQTVQRTGQLDTRGSAPEYPLGLTGGDLTTKRNDEQFMNEQNPRDTNITRYGL